MALCNINVILFGNVMLSVHTKIGGGGRIVIPCEYREKLNIKEGDYVTLTIDEFGIHISNARLAIKKMQNLMKERIPDGVSLAGELIAERRKQAKKE